MTTILRRSILQISSTVRFSSDLTAKPVIKCKLLVIGAGAGGCSVAHRFARRLQKDEIVILEPSKVHCFMEQLTLVGAGMKSMGQCLKKTRDVLPKNAIWVNEGAKHIDPKRMEVTTTQNSVIKCEYMVIAIGREHVYEKVPGLRLALEEPHSGVCSVYDPKYAWKAYQTMKGLRAGDAIFARSDDTLASFLPIEMAYIADDYFRLHGHRGQIKIQYITHGAPVNHPDKYIQTLMDINKSRNIPVKYHTDLTEVKSGSKEAVFSESNGKLFTQKYQMLHVTPAMEVPSVLRDNPDLRSKHGTLDTNIYTMQSNRFPRIFAIGNCNDVPISDCAASRGPQSFVLEQNLLKVMLKQETSFIKFDGFRAIPYVTSLKKAILAEYIGVEDPKVVQTFYCNQASESRYLLLFRKYAVPFIYWNLLITGKYNHCPSWSKK